MLFRLLTAIVLATAPSLLLASQPPLLPAAYCRDYSRQPLQCKPWTEATKAFRSEPRWLGGDGVSSVNLGHGRILWLFGDSFIATSPARSRSESVMVRNSIAIQRGLDPATAKFSFHWRHEAGKPASFFPEDRSMWLWPGDGICLDGQLFLFFLVIRKTGELSQFGFQSIAWRVFAVDNPAAPPEQWHIRRVATPATKDRVMVGSGALVEHGEYVYAFSARERKNHDVFVLRWLRADLAAHRLSQGQWWCGTSWSHDQKPQPLFSHGQTEFTVHYEERLGCWLQVQGMGFGMVPLAWRHAPDVTGPWSPLRPFYEAPDKHRQDLFLYAVKAHPCLAAGPGSLAVSYVTNASTLQVLANDMNCYFPRMVRLQFR